MVDFWRFLGCVLDSWSRDALNASHRRRWISILDLYLFDIDYFDLSCLLVENGSDLHWCLGDLFLISEDNGGLDGVAISD